MKGKAQYREHTNFNILLADDDPDDKAIFMEALSELDLDVSVFTVKNGKEAIEYLESAAVLPDILFLDLSMPVMNGRECLKKVRADTRYRDISIVIYSTSSNNEDIEETLALGANVYIKKPNDFEQLKTILYKLITVNGQVREPYLKKEFFMMNLGS